VNAFPTYLWKEWREQRGTLALLAAALCVGVASVIATLPRAAAADSLTFQCVVAGTLAAAILTVGADLLSRERERGLRFLERHPGGLATAFRAKLVFLLGVVALALAFGVLLAATAARLRSGAWPAADLGLGFALSMGPLVVLSLWTFAASAWMPNSALALPASSLLLSALGWPVILVVLREPGFQPTDVQVVTFAALCVLGAPASAWAAFVAASRAGGTRRAAACAGLAVAALAFAPSWGWAALRFHASRHTSYEFGAAWVGADGRYAFLNAMRSKAPGDDDMLYSALRVDLREGSWCLLGERDASLFLPPRESQRVRVAPDTPRSEWLRLVDQSGEAGNESLVDPLRGEVLDDEPEPVTPAVTPVDFGLQTAPRTWSVTRVGLGMRLDYREEGSTQPRMRYLAPDGRIVADDELPRDGYGHALATLLVRPGRWLARGAQGWSLFDPEHGTLEDVAGLSPKEFLGPLLDDGRALLVAQDRLFLLDLDSGERTSIETTDPTLQRVRSVSSTGNTSGFLPTDHPALVVVMDGRTSRLGWLDTQAATLRSGPSGGDLHLAVLWSEGMRAVVLEGRQRLALHDVGAETRRVLLDAADLR
jgi:hypothetical protein